MLTLMFRRKPNGTDGTDNLLGRAMLGTDGTDHLSLGKIFGANLALSNFTARCLMMILVGFSVEAQDVRHRWHKLFFATEKIICFFCTMSGSCALDKKIL